MWTGEESAFSEQLTAIRQSAPASARFVLVTATVPQPVFEQLTQSEFPGMAVALGPRLHRPPAGVRNRAGEADHCYRGFQGLADVGYGMARAQESHAYLTSCLSLWAGLVETLIDCSGGTVINEEAGAARKLDALQRVLRKVPTLRTVVFCNKIETCRKVCMRALGALHHAPAARHTKRRCSSQAAVVAACSMTVPKHVQAIHRPCNTSCCAGRKWSAAVSTRPAHPGISCRHQR